MADGAEEIVVRGRSFPLPSSDEYSQHGIELEEPPRVRVFELCRFLADVARDVVLATAQERRTSVLPDMTQILQLEDWHHPTSSIMRIVRADRRLSCNSHKSLLPEK